MASMVGRGGQSGGPHNHSHARPRATAVSHLPTCPAAWVERDEWVGDTTAYKQEAAGYLRLRSTEDGRKAQWLLVLSQPTYSRHVLRSSWAIRYTLAHRPTGTSSSWHVKYALASLHETG